MSLMSRGAMLSVCAGMMALMAPIARAQTYTWQGGDGCWCTLSMWSPTGSPTPTSTVEFGGVTPYTVRTSFSTCQAGTMHMNNPLATIAVNGGETLRLSGGLQTLNGLLKIGDGTFGNPAVLDVSGVPSAVQFTGTAGVLRLQAHPSLVLPFAVIRGSGRVLTLDTGLRLEGRGAVQSQVVNSGTISPGVGAGGVGEISFDFLTLQPASVLEFDIVGPGFNEADRVTVSFGQPQLGGTIRVRRAPGFTPAIGATFTLLQGGGVSGSFATIDAPGFTVSTAGGQVRATFVGTPCTPDYTTDGNVDQDDVALLIDIVAGSTGASPVDPDFNHDGNVDQDDVAALVNVVAGGACP